MLLFLFVQSAPSVDQIPLSPVFCETFYDDLKESVEIH